MSGIQQMRIFGGSYIPNFIGLMTSSNYPSTSAIDINGNMYIVGTASGNKMLVKIDSSGIIKWQKSLTSSSGGYLGISVNSAGTYIYVVGFHNGGNGETLILKYDSSGNIQWQRNLSSGSLKVSPGFTYLDSSENLYVSTTLTNSNPNYNAGLVKYDSSGSLQMQKYVYRSGYPYDDVSGVAVDVDVSRNYSYLVGSRNSYGMIVCMDTTGSLSWGREFYGGSYTYLTGVAVDGAGNFYVCGTSNSTGTSNLIIAKYNPSGVIQWQRRLGGSGETTSSNNITISPDGYIYVTGSCLSGGSFEICIVKYNSSGVIQFQRSLGISTSTERGYGISVDANNMYIAGQATISGLDTTEIACLPSNGSKTGAYTVSGNTIVYAASSFTESASSLTDDVSPLSVSTSSLTDASSSFTSSSLSLSLTVSNI